MQHLCREYTMPRYEKKTRAKGGILKNTRIGPVLDIQVCRHKDRYCIDVLVESLFQDRTASWVRIVSGIDKYVTESMETKKEEHRALVRPVAKARPRLKPAVTLSSVSVPPHERKWIDIEEHDHDCFTVSKAMIRPLRHGQSDPREEDGAVRFDDILEEVKKKKVDGASQWSLNDWISTLAKGGRAKKRFPDCLNPNSSNHFLNLRAVQGHSGGNALDPELQDNVVSPEGFTEYIYHVGNASEINSIIRSGLIPGGRSLKRGRQSVFFTGTITMCEVCERTKTTRARSETKPKKRMDGLARIHRSWTSNHGSPQNSARGK